MFTKKDFCSRIDHSLLGWTATREQLKQFCDEAAEFGFASVCINPNYVAEAASLLEGRSGISAVCGFPCGANTTKIKIAEGIQAIEDGATELDFVSDLSLLKNGEDDKLMRQYLDIVGAIRDKRPETVIKFIVYAPYGSNPALTWDETRRICALVAESGADFIKYFYENPDVIRTLTGGKVKQKYSAAHCFDIVLDNMMNKGVERVGADAAAVWLRERGDDFWAAL